MVHGPIEVWPFAASTLLSDDSPLDAATLLSGGTPLDAALVDVELSS